MSDNVNHPQHYTAGTIETIEIIKSVCNSLPLTPFEGLLLGNVIKYISRYKHKNGLEDLRKAEWYLNQLAESQQEIETASKSETEEPVVPVNGFVVCMFLDTIHQM